MSERPFIDDGSTRDDQPTTGGAPTTDDRPDAAHRLSTDGGSNADHRSPAGDATLGRRRVLAGLGGALAVGVAGCSSVTEQSFEATPVILPEGAREEFVLAETARDSETVSREGPGGTEVEITNHGTVYRRGTARGRPTVLERFAGGVNRTPGSGSNINAVAAIYDPDDPDAWLESDAVIALEEGA